MTVEELLIFLRSMRWNLLGEGASNRAYLSGTLFSLDGEPECHWVLKERKSSDDAACHSVRLVAKWKAINPDIPVYKISDNEWMVPYLGDTQAPDERIAEEVLRIYLKTRNIIVDACVDNNFLMVAGRAVCIDMDYAWRPRRASMVSDAADAWDWEKIDDLLSRCRPEYPLTTSLIRTLRYLENALRPAEIDDRYITSSMMAKLRIFRLYKIPLNTEIMNDLLPLTGADFDKFIVLFNSLNKPDNLLRVEEVRNLLKMITLNIANELPSEDLRRLLSTDPLTSHDTIHIAVRWGLYNVVKVLTDKNPSLSFIKGICNICPLHRVLEVLEPVPQRRAVLELLLSKDGISINEQIQSEDAFNGYTPLDAAITAGLTEEAALLRAHGALTGEELSARAASTASSESAVAVASADSPVSITLARLGVFGGEPARPLPVTEPLPGRRRAYTV
jgi:hypothetical protein